MPEASRPTAHKFIPNDTLSNKSSTATRVLRIALVAAALVGLGFSIHYNRTLTRLQKDHAALQTQAGVLNIADPSKVAIAHVPHTNDIVPPGITKAHAWRHRMYIPANYGVCIATKRGLITADSPQGKGGGGSSTSGADPLPIEMVVTTALVKSDGRWLLSHTGGGGSSTSSLPEDFNLDSLDDFVIETVVSADDTSRVFDPDEAICLLRLREKELPKKKKNGQEKKGLYRGFSVYLYSADRKDAFTAWASGKTDSMEETK